MKRFYLLSFAVLSAMAAMAQPVTYLSRKGTGASSPGTQLTREQMQQAKGYTGEKASGNYFLDYDAYDSDFHTMQTFVINSNTRDTSAFGMHKHYVAFDTLVVTPDGVSNFEFFNRGDYVAMVVDTIYMRFHHQKQSSTNDTLTIRIVDLDANGRPTTNVLWSTQEAIDTSLTGFATSQGYPVRTFRFPCGYTLSAGSQGRFGIEVYFSGEVQDTFSLQYSYPTDGTLCGPGPDPQPVASEFYPTTFYRVSTGGSGTSVIVPNAAGQVALFGDCNGNNQFDGPQENFFQNWIIWTNVTLTQDAGVQDGPQAQLLQLQPNPASGQVMLRFHTDAASEVYTHIADLSGRVLQTQNHGNFASGDQQLPIDVSAYPDGVYLVTLHTGQQSVTRRLVVRH